MRLSPIRDKVRRRFPNDNSEQAATKPNDAWVRLPNSVVRDKRLSEVGLVLLAYRATFTDTFTLNATALRRKPIVRGGGLGCNAIKRAIAEKVMSVRRNTTGAQSTPSSSRHSRMTPCRKSARPRRSPPSPTIPTSLSTMRFFFDHANHVEDSHACHPSTAWRI